MPFTPIEETEVEPARFTPVHETQPTEEPGLEALHPEGALARIPAVAAGIANLASWPFRAAAAVPFAAAETLREGNAAQTFPEALATYTESAHIPYIGPKDVPIGGGERITLGEATEYALGKIFETGGELAKAGAGETLERGQTRAPYWMGPGDTQFESAGRAGAGSPLLAAVEETLANAAMFGGPMARAPKAGKTGREVSTVVREPEPPVATGPSSIDQWLESRRQARTGPIQDVGEVGGVEPGMGLARPAVPDQVAAGRNAAAERDLAAARDRAQAFSDRMQELRARSEEAGRVQYEPPRKAEPVPYEVTPEMAARDRAQAEVKGYTPYPDLQPDERAVETRFAEQLSENRGGAIQEYKSRFGNVISTDLAKELSPDYVADKTQYSRAAHEPASALVKEIYREELRKPPPEGKSNMVVFTAGGTGAGKTTAINANGFGNLADSAQIVYDSNMNGYESSKTKIDQALDAGKSVAIIYVYRDPVKALIGQPGMGGALSRAAKIGRTVPLDEHAKTHVGSRETVQRIANEYGSNPNVSIYAISNEAPGVKGLRPLEAFPKHEYNDIYGRLQAALDEEHAAGRVSDKIYAASSRGQAGAGQGRAPSTGEPRGGAEEATVLGVKAADLVRRDSKGRIIGGFGSRHLATVNAALKRMEKLAREGEVGRAWYADSAKAILDSVGGDKNAADRIAQVLAITSAGTEIKANFTMAAKALEQYARGEPIHVATKQKDLALENLLRKGIVPESVKVDDFYKNLAQHITGEMVDRPVSDRWQLRIASGDLGRVAHGAPARQYEYTAMLASETAKRLGWRPDEAQAAMWVAMKAQGKLKAMQLSAKESANSKFKGMSKDELKRLALENARTSFASEIAVRGWKPPEGIKFPPLEELRTLGVRDDSMAKDMFDQLEYLNEKARDLGYPDADALHEAKPRDFNRFAEEWRNRHEAEALASKGKGVDQISLSLVEPTGELGKKIATRFSPPNLERYQRALIEPEKKIISAAVRDLINAGMPEHVIGGTPGFAATVKKPWEKHPYASYDLGNRVISVLDILDHDPMLLRGHLAHELGHLIDDAAGTLKVADLISAQSPRMKMRLGEFYSAVYADGDIAKEALDRWTGGKMGGSSKVAELLDYPLGFEFPSVAHYQIELFAQLNRLYFTNPKLMQKELPIAYSAMKEIYDNAGTSLEETRDAIRTALRSPGAAASGSGSRGRESGQGSLFQAAQRSAGERGAGEGVVGVQAPAKHGGRADRVDQTETPEFKRFIEGSRVTKTGKPWAKPGDELVVYHGTRSPSDFTEFSTSGPPFDESGEGRIDSGSGGDFTAYMGAHFSKEKSVANQFATGRGHQWLKERVKGPGRVVPVYLKIEKPLRINEDDLREKVRGSNLSEVDVTGQLDQDITEALERYVGSYGENKKSPKDFDARSALYDKDAEYRGRIHEFAQNLADESGRMEEFGSAVGDAAKELLRREGYDGVIYSNTGEGGTSYIAFRPEQIKSAIGNRGTFDPENASILGVQAGGGGKKPPGAVVPRGGAPNPYWDVDQPGLRDNLTRAWQNNQIDLKKTQEAIERAAGTITEKGDAYLAEELYRDRVTSRVKRDYKNQVEPILKDIKDAGLTVDETSRYLWARHAPERNKAMEKINPGETDLSGLSDVEAKQILASFSPAKRAALDGIGTKIDALTASTRQILEREGLEDKTTLMAWERAYKHYVPLFRDIDETGTGSGFQVKGPESKRAMGSKREAQAVLAAAIAQHERAIVRAEKARVGRALIKLAEDHPNPDFWKVDQPPMKRSVNPSTGLVQHGIDPLYRQRDDVFIVKDKDAAGKVVERVLAFNPKNERAMQIAKAMKNLDVVQLSAVTQVVGKVTRILANLATSWNPGFWATNFVRDVQTAAVNLQSTPLNGHAPRVIANIPRAIGGILSAEFGKGGGKWATAYREFESAGGKMEWGSIFNDLVERQKQLVSDIKSSQRSNLNPVKWAKTTLEMIEGINSAIENATRLSAYVEGVDSGMSSAKSASLAKNMTVNFRRKGEQSTGIGAWYMFFNANVQGTARLFQAIAKSRKAQAMVGLMVAFGAGLELLNRMIGEQNRDEDGNNPYELINEDTKEKNMIFMTPSGKQASLPLPYGFGVFHNAGRIMMESTLAASNSGLVDEKKGPGETAWNFAKVLMDSFMPIGSAGTPAQLIAPSVLDPAVQYAENKTWYGAPIRPEPQSFGPATPNHKLYFRSTSDTAKDLAKWLSDTTGGDEVRGGAIDISPTTMTHTLGSISGGTGRFGLGMFDFTKHMVNRLAGEESPEDMSWRSVPFVGKFYGEVEDRDKAAKFYRLRAQAMDVWKQMETYRKMREYDKAAEVEESNPALAAMARELVAKDFKKQMSEARGQYKVIDEMPRSEREAARRDLRADETAIMSRAIRAYNEAAQEQRR